MDPFRLCVALGPLGVYSLILAIMHLSKRAWVVSGPRDMVALGVALAGFMMVGPVELIMPAEPWATYRAWAWLVVLITYGVGTTLVALLGRPRITFYNITPAILRPVLAQVASALDPQSRWAGNSLVMPQLDVELSIEAMSPMRCASLVATHEEQEFHGWRRLETSLAAALMKVECSRSPWGWLFLAVSTVLLGVVVFAIAWNPDAVNQGFLEMMRLEGE